MDITKYPPSAQLTRVADLLTALFGQGARGLSTSELAKATGQSQSYVTQQLGQMAHLGLVEEVADTGRWRPGVRWARMATALHLSIQRDLDSLSEFQQRITRT